MIMVRCNLSIIYSKALLDHLLDFHFWSQTQESGKKKLIEKYKLIYYVNKKQALQSVDETCCEFGANLKHQAVEVNENPIHPLSHLSQGFICSVWEAGGETPGPAHEANTLGCVQAKLTHTHCLT